jgi:hypothetical protein
MLHFPSIIPILLVRRLHMHNNIALVEKDTLDQEIYACGNVSIDNANRTSLHNYIMFIKDKSSIKTITTLSTNTHRMMLTFFHFK